MRSAAKFALLAALIAVPGAAAAGECAEPYGRLVEVSPFVYEVRVKPECAKMVAAAPEAGMAPAASLELAERPRRHHEKPAGRSAALRETPAAVELASSEAGCAAGIGSAHAVSDMEIVVGFRPECKHLAAVPAPRSSAQNALTDFFLDDGGFEEEITPRRTHRPKPAPAPCDDAGCTALLAPQHLDAAAVFTAMA